MLPRGGGLSPSNAIVRYYCLYPSCLTTYMPNADLHRNLDEFDRIYFHTDILQDIVDHVNVSHVGEQYKCPLCDSFWSRTVNFIQHLHVKHTVTVSVPDDGHSVLEPDTSQLTKHRAHLFFLKYVKQRQVPSTEATLPRSPVQSPQKFDRRSFAFGSIMGNRDTGGATWVPADQNYEVHVPGRLGTAGAAAAGSSAPTSRPASFWTAGPVHPNNPLYCRNTSTSFFPHPRHGNESWVRAVASASSSPLAAETAAIGPSLSMGNLNINRPQLPNANTDFGSLIDLARPCPRDVTGAQESGEVDSETGRLRRFDQNNCN